MTHRLSLLLVLSLAVPATAQKQLLKLEQTLPGLPGAVHFYSGVPKLAWADDGRHLQVEQRGRRIWIEPRAWKPQLAPGETLRQRRSELAKALGALPGLEPPAVEHLVEAAKPEGGDAVWSELDHDLYFQRQGGPALRLTRDGQPKLETELAPGGRHVAFVRGHDLFVVATDTGAETAVTSDGSDNLLYGRLDWVYQEEVYDRGDFKGFWWSPRGDALVFYRLDESHVKRFTVVDHVPDPTLEHEHSVVAEVSPYPKAGDPNPVVGLGIARTGGDSPVWVDLHGYDPDVLIVRAGWNADGSKVVFQIQDRIQTWLDLCYADPATGAVTRILHEQVAKGWVNVLGEPRWLADGSFLWLSERTGYQHVYHYSAAGELLGAVTSGEWAVGEILKVDERQQRLWFTATLDGAVETNAYRIGLDGSDLTRITEGRGTHDIALNGDGSLYVDRFSSLEVPPELRLCDGDGKVLRVVQKGPVPRLETHVFEHRELLKIPARDGFEMDAALLRPMDFDPHKTYPVLLDTYSGPDTPTVTDSWNAGADPWHQFLAQQGVLVLQVNNRSSSGRGQVFTAACYRDFGASELRDLEDAIDWLCRNPWADGSRVAITGWSYGGTMTVYAMTHSDRFALGLAGGGVYDWRLYDSIYTERYMSTPEKNPDGYRKSSCITAAAQLRGHLLMVHGTMDDNVHLQNLVQMVYALEEAGKDFDMMIYPKSRHGVRDGKLRLHMRKLYWREIRRFLLGQ